MFTSKKTAAGSAGESLLPKDDTAKPKPRPELKQAKSKERNFDADFMQHMEQEGKGKFKLTSLDALFCLYFRSKTESAKRAEYQDVPEPLSGDIYRYLALYGQRAHRPWQLLGMVCVMLIQLVGPLAILVENLRTMDHSNLSIGLGGASGLDAVSIILKRVLSALFLSIFVLNGRRYNEDSRESLTKLKKMLTKLELKFSQMPRFKTLLTDNTNFRWISIGAFVNSWVIVMCTLDMFFILMFEDGAKDVVFDSLGLLFLYNLDDVTGDFALLDESDWDEERMGKFFTDIAAESADSDPLPEKSCVHDFPEAMCHRIARVTRVIVMLYMVLPLAMLLIDPGN